MTTKSKIISQQNLKIFGPQDLRTDQSSVYNINY